MCGLLWQIKMKILFENEIQKIYSASRVQNENLTSQNLPVIQ